MKIGIISVKKGVGKTTSAIYLALAAIKNDQRVRVLDADIQGYASKWYYGARFAGAPLPFKVSGVNMEDLKYLHIPDDEWAIIDAAPERGIIDACIKVVDYVIIPTSDSPADLHQVRVLLEAVPADKPCFVLITKAQKNTIAFHQTIDVLNDTAHEGTDLIPNFETVIPMRQDIKKAWGTVPNKLYEYGEAYIELREEIDGRKSDSTKNNRGDKKKDMVSLTFLVERSLRNNLKIRVAEKRMKMAEAGQEAISMWLEKNQEPRTGEPCF